MGNRAKQAPSGGSKNAEISVREIIRNARGSLTQAGFIKFLHEHHGIKTSQGLLSKYESGKTNPPADFIDKCMKIIHGENIEGDISLDALEDRMRKVLGGPAQAEARKAFAVILNSISLNRP